MTKEIKTDGQDPMIQGSVVATEVKGGDHEVKPKPQTIKQNNPGFDPQPQRGPGLYVVDPRA